jgi:hypothetical protein
MMFLKVPFAEKDEAKALGARWNGERKSWYVPDGKDTAPFERWLPPGGADFVPAKAAGSIKAKPASVDSYVGKNVVGKFYQQLDHDCNPFTVCPVCAPILKQSGWQEAHDAVQLMLTAIRA